MDQMHLVCGLSQEEELGKYKEENTGRYEDHNCNFTYAARRVQNVLQTRPGFSAWGGDRELCIMYTLEMTLWYLVGEKRLHNNVAPIDARLFQDSAHKKTIGQPQKAAA